MADWYVSSVSYNANPTWAPTTAYSVGQFIRPLTPSNGGTGLWTYRCTTAGTTTASEPTWSSASHDGQTITSGAVFTNVSGQAAYGWTAAAGSLYCMGTDLIVNRPNPGDRVFVASDHVENITTGAVVCGFGTNGFGSIQIISVNRAGSVPPVAADILNGASVSFSGGLSIDSYCGLFIQGVTFNNTSTTSSANLRLSQAVTGNHNIYLKNCLLALTGGVANFISCFQQTKVILDNTPVSFSNVGSSIGVGNGPTMDLLWINTPNAVQGTIPPALFTGEGSTGAGLLIVCRGVDLSAITGNLVLTSSQNWTCKSLFDSCRIASGVSRSIGGSPIQDLELINCYDGTSVLNERHIRAGDVVTDRTVYLTGGGQDEIGNYSLKMMSSANSDFTAYPLDCFWIDVENTVTGSAKTATIEVVSSYVLTNTDIRLLLEYMGTSASPIASFGDNLPTVLSVPVALPSSTGSWPGPAYAQWNPVDSTSITLSGSSLTATASAGPAGVRAMTGFGSGKLYFEITMTTWLNANTAPGLSLFSAVLTAATAAGTTSVLKSGSITVNGSASGSTLGARSSGDVIGIAVDLGANLIWFRVAPAGNWNGSGAANPATGTGGLSISAMTGIQFPSFFGGAVNDAATANFGASAMSGALPSGFTAGWSGTPTSRQLLQVGFTPQRAGRVRGLVRLAKTTATVWVNPVMSIA